MTALHFTATYLLLCAIFISYAVLHVLRTDRDLWMIWASPFAAVFCAVVLGSTQ